MKVERIKEKLYEMLCMQSRLDDAILKEHHSEFDMERSRRALIDELGEMNHEDKASWCWWKYTQSPVDRDKLLEELVDAWHFAMSIANHTNTPSSTVTSGEIIKYRAFTTSVLIAWAITKYECILNIMIALTYNLGFNFDDVYSVYQKKNAINYKRLESGY